MKAIYLPKCCLALPVALVLTACSSTQPPVPTPVPTPTARPTPVPVSPRPAGDWRDAPITPGNWFYARVQDNITHSPPPQPLFVASFGADRRSEVITLTCGLNPTTLTLSVAGQGEAPLGLTITTTSVSRAFTATRNRATGWWEINLAPRDPILDAMAFSRGRFMVAVEGQAALYLPSWPEVSRVIEDCR